MFPGERPVGLRERLVEGAPSEVLIRASEGAELLVVDHRGRGGFARAMLGSVSRRCAQRASCPVVVVRHGQASGHWIRLPAACGARRRQRPPVRSRIAVTSRRTSSRASAGSAPRSVRPRLSSTCSAPPWQGVVSLITS